MLPIVKGISLTISTLLLLISFGQPSSAQIIPDNTLPNNSLIFSPDGKVQIINGGTQAGANLFHSFEQFSIQTGETAFFNNPIEIQNIFSRVTGSSISTINGLITANGSPNLFLINPNGITFGPNAAIALGSFYASSGNRVIFADGLEFSAETPQSTLLSFNRPIGLGFNNPGPITVQGNGHSFQYLAFAAPILPVISADNLGQLGGLRTFPRGKIALIGGEVHLNNTSLVGIGGKIELIGIEQGIYNLETPEQSRISTFKDISISSSAIGLTGLGLGQLEGIQLWGRNITIANGSLIFNQNVGATASGDIDIMASDNVTITGNLITNPTVIRNLTLQPGNSGNIHFTTNGTLKISQVAAIDTATFSSGDAGQIKVITQNLFVSESIPGGPITGLSTLVNQGATGNGGDIVLRVGNLDIAQGGGIVTTTIGDEITKAGNIFVDADTVNLSGASSDGASPSQLSSVTFGKGDAGDITINTRTVEIRRGGNINSLGVDAGNAGNLTIVARERIRISESPQTVDLEGFGLSDTNLLRQSGLIQSTIGIPPQAVLKFFGVEANPTGNAGNIEIHTPQLFLSDNAAISVGNVGTGQSGDLSIYAQEISLDQASSISSGSLSGNGGNLLLKADKLSLNQFSGLTVQAGANVTGLDIPVGNEGDGGNIKIDVADIQLTNNSIFSARSTLGNGGNISINANTLSLERSQITAQAGNRGNGGNITINSSRGIILFDGSLISAQAVAGRGGNIQINTPVLLTSFNSTISASSELGIDGIVEIPTPDNNLLSGIIPVEAQIIDIDQTISQSCLKGNQLNQSVFIIKESGNLSPSPDEMPSRFVESPLSESRAFSEESNESRQLHLSPNAIIKTNEGHFLLVNLCTN